VTPDWVVIYCDGSALKNPGPGGYAWWYNQSSWQAEGFTGPVTNNAMELAAIARILEQVPSTQNLVIRTDSKYSIDAVTKWAHGWKRNNWAKKDGKEISNLAVIQEIFTQLNSGRKVKLEWVRGHNGDPGNERADSLARNAAIQAKNGRGNHALGPGWVL